MHEGDPAAFRRHSDGIRRNQAQSGGTPGVAMT